MKIQVIRLFVSLLGILSTTFLYHHYRNLSEVLSPDADTWFYSLLIVTFIVGLLIELLPFPQKLTFSWSSLLLTVSIFIIVFFIHSSYLLKIFGFNDVTEVLANTQWVYPMGSILLGILVGKTFKDK